MDIESALIFSASMLLAYCIVLWIQHSAWKEFKTHKQQIEKSLFELTTEINNLKKLSSSSTEPKKILVDQKSLYSIK